MSGRDLFFIMATLFMFGIGLVMANFISHSITDKLQSNPKLNTTPEFNKVLQSQENASNMLDYVFMGLFVGFILFVIVSGWFVAGHPIFTVFYVIFGVIAVFISPIISNVWETFTTSAILGSTINYFPLTDHILKNLPIYLTVIMVIGMIVLFGKPYFVQGGANEAV